MNTVLYLCIAIFGGDEWRDESMKVRGALFVRIFANECMHVSVL